MRGFFYAKSDDGKHIGSPRTSIKAHLPDGASLSLGSSRWQVPQIWPPFSRTGPPVSSRSRCDHSLALLYSHMLSPAQLWMLQLTGDWIACDHVLPAPFSLPSLSLCLLSVTAPSARLSPRCGTGYMVIRRNKTCLTRWRTCAPYYGN